MMIDNHSKQRTSFLKDCMLKRCLQSYMLITAQMKIISLQQRLTNDKACVNPLREFPWVFQVHQPIETDSSQMASQMRLANISQRTLCFCWQGLQLQSRKAKIARGRLQSLRSGQLRKARRAIARKWQLNNSFSFISFNDYKVTIISQSHPAQCILWKRGEIDQLDCFVGQKSKQQKSLVFIHLKQLHCPPEEVVKLFIVHRLLCLRDPLLAVINRYHSLPQLLIFKHLQQFRITSQLLQFTYRHSQVLI